MTHIIHKDELPHSETAHRFEGHLNGGPDVSFFLIDSDRGGGPDLHTHPYAEVFVIQEGEVIFTAGEETIEAQAGQGNSPRTWQISARPPKKRASTASGWPTTCGNIRSWAAPRRTNRNATRRWRS